MSRQRPKKDHKLKRGLNSGAGPKNPPPLYGVAEEEQRADTISTLGLLDTPPEERFDRISRLAREVMGAPATYISLIDRERQWFKSTCGMGDVKETPRVGTFCDYAIRRSRPTVVLDADRDPFFCKSPYVTDYPKVKFYVGIPLLVDGQRVGTLCALDFQARGEVPDQQMEAFEQLAAMAEAEFTAGSGALSGPSTSSAARRAVSVLCCELRESQMLAEELEADLAVAVLNVFVESMAQTAQRWGGTVDDLTDGALRVFFNGPQELAEHAVHAAACGLEMQLCMAEVNHGLQERGLFPLSCGVGIHTAEMLVGSLGTQELWKTTVVGNGVRLTEQIVKVCAPGQVLVSSSVHDGLGDSAHTRGDFELRLQSDRDPVLLYSLVGLGELALPGWETA